MSSDILKTLGDDAVLVPLPNFGNGVYTDIGSTCWGMLSAAQKDGVESECWTILSSMMSKENVKGISEANGAIPSLISVLNEEPNYKSGGRFYLYREQLESGIGIVRPQTPASASMSVEIGKAFLNILSGQSAQSALNEASQNLDDTITQNGYNSK